MSQPTILGSISPLADLSARLLADVDEARISRLDRWRRQGVAAGVDETLVFTFSFDVELILLVCEGRASEPEGSAERRKSFSEISLLFCAASLVQ